MKIKELIKDYNGAMTAKYKSKLTTFRKIEYLKKKLYDEYPNQYRVEMWKIPDEMVEEKKISEQINDRNTWEYTDGKDIKDITSAIGGYHYKKIYKNIKSEICVLVDEYQSPGDYRPTYIYYIIYIKNVAFL